MMIQLMCRCCIDWSFPSFLINITSNFLNFEGGLSRVGKKRAFDLIRSTRCGAAKRVAI